MGFGVDPVLCGVLRGTSSDPARRFSRVDTHLLIVRYKDPKGTSIGIASFFFTAKTHLPCRVLCKFSLDL